MALSLLNKANLVKHPRAPLEERKVSSGPANAGSHQDTHILSSFLPVHCAVVLNPGEDMLIFRYR